MADLASSWRLRPFSVRSHSGNVPLAVEVVKLSGNADLLLDLSRQRAREGDEAIFCFALNRDLPGSTYRKYPPEAQKQLLATLMPVSWPLQSPYTQSPIPLLERLLSES